MLRSLGLWKSCLLLIFIALLLFTASLLQMANPLDPKSYEIVVPKGSSMIEVKQLLEEAGILPRASSFGLAARALGLSTEIKAGKYHFSPSESLLSVLVRLKQGDVVEPELTRVKVTFPEGLSIYRMAEILRASGVSDPDKFQALVKEGINEPLRNAHWSLFKYIPSESLEGYLYPDTYWFFQEATVRETVEIMLTRFEEKVLPFWDKAKGDTHYNLHEILTLASIIEKEAKQPGERVVISSVFYNRLRIGMPLAADPTVKYALDNPTKKVYRNQLTVDSLYNTYKYKGLPPGPICNPGIESIMAAVYPAKTDYYYFVAKKDGLHLFSKSWAEHQKARIKAASK